MKDFKAVIQHFPGWRRACTNWWEVYLMAGGVLPEPRLFKIRDRDLKFFSRNRDKVVLREHYAGGSHLDFVDLSEYDAVADVGAHIGVFSVEAAGAGNEVRAFEPNPSTFEILRKNIEINACSDVEAVNAAVSSSSGEAELSRGRMSVGDSIRGGGEISVRTVGMDEALEDFDFSGKKLLKLDCEGSEFPIIEESGDELLRRFDTLIVEWHRQAGNPEKLSEMMEDAGFEVIYMEGEETGNIGYIVAEKN